MQVDSGTVINVELRRQVGELEEQSRQLADQVNGLMVLQAALNDWTRAVLNDPNRALDKYDKRLLLEFIDTNGT